MKLGQYPALGNGDVGPVIEDVIGPLAPADQLAAHDETAFGEADFLADLCHLIPPRPRPGAPPGGGPGVTARP